MKTLIHFCDFENWPEFYIVDGNYSHLNDVLINSTDSPEHLQDEASNLLFDQETGCIKLTEVELSLLDIVYEGLPQDTIVIRIGFLP